ncbi:hypothetical protein JOF56_008022 [Kibdelosporangium banguiense]|uniref:DUF4350 domain-containing protein n=1 Tax=Kibdelosporangium banguiense TaxID=1365924 RepID=A0ABS4TTB7_9PSEU|nr:DUF4350 domain-containing protein [Kibdelosporangium banguiense]MBP2327637.1 hypothetical protein [Kibdelosporangium banguiense]
MSTSVSPDARRIWAAARGPLIIGVIVLATVIVMSLFRDSPSLDALDPDSVAPTGSRAVARLLTAQGVQIHPVDTAQAAGEALDGGATLLITQPNWVNPVRLNQLRDQARTVVAIAPQGDAVGALIPGVDSAASVPTGTREPGCSLPAARAAGAARIGGITYSDEFSCYDGTLVARSQTILLGGAAPLSNETLAEEGNAALALRLLGQHQRLVWYRPSLADPARDGGQQSFYDLIPPGWKFGLGQVVIAILLFMLWRGRRLGPVVTEPLPVVVRAAETAEGRARLYRRAGATDHAADALRRSAINRLIPLLGLTSDATPEAVADAVAAHTGRDARMVLCGPPPGTEQALVDLAGDLDRLTDEIGPL